ncbi:MAG: hypothetical protein ACLQKA_01675 [Bryobacteraceae bacterium]
MALSIERLRYYDGEYLRAYDWTAEQTYQIEMRRRLHLAMGHWGIVEGLDIASDTEGNTTTFAINPGVAIDPAGREIFVFNAYQLDDTLLNANLITTPNTYQLLLQYQLIPNTPPAAGYGQCSGGNQYTRWQEGFAVLIKPKTWTQPTPLPKATDALSENAAQDGFAVPLANVVIGPDSSGSLVVLSFSTTNRRYCGTRTQCIAPPIRAAKPDITAAETPLNPPTSIEVHSSVYVHDNLIVGQNFALAGNSPPTPASMGSVKVAGDIVLQGKIYTEDVNSNWTDLVSALQSQVVPQIVMSSSLHVISLPGAGSTIDVSTGIDPSVVQVPTTFPVGKFNVSASAWVAGVSLRDNTTVQQVLASTSGQIAYSASVTATPDAQNADLQFTWSVSPVAHPGTGGASSYTSAVESISVGYVVVFTPKSS